MRSLRIGDLFTEREIRRALRIWQGDRAHFHARVLREIVEPNMARINTTTGQENVPGYLAYVLEYTIMLMDGCTR